MTLHKYVAMFFMLNRGPNKVGKGKDHCYLMFLILVLASKLGNTMKIFWELGGNIFKTPKSGGKKKKSLKMNIEIFIF